jgi:hypothetical protein
MKPLFAISGALLVSAAAMAQSDAGAERTMTATVVEGNVTLQRDAGSAMALQQGLREGDAVQTGSDSRLEIYISDGSVLRVGENTKLELRVAPPAGKMFAARLWLGAVWAKVHKLLSDESFHVETENAVAGVRGTEFLVQAGGGTTCGSTTARSRSATSAANGCTGWKPGANWPSCAA